MSARRPKPIRLADLTWASVYPPHPAKGARSSRVIYAAVGEALSYWEFLETYQARLLVALNPGELFVPNILLRAFGAIESFSAKNRVIQEAAKTYFHWYPDKPLEKEVRSLLGGLLNLAEKRNHIAHGMVFPYPMIIAGKSPKEWILAPPMHSSKRRKAIQHVGVAIGSSDVPKYAYGPKEILAAAREFEAATKRLIAVGGRLDAKRLTRPGRRLGSPGRPPPA